MQETSLSWSRVAKAQAGDEHDGADQEQVQELRTVIVFHADVVLSCLRR
jgi:hypothetical protein